MRFGIWGLGSGFRVQGGFRVSGVRFRVQGSGTLPVSKGLGFRVQGSFRVWDLWLLFRFLETCHVAANECLDLPREDTGFAFSVQGLGLRVNGSGI